MTLSEARKLVREPAATFDAVQAVEELCAVSGSTLVDLLWCLTHDGLPAERAALELYARLGLPLPSVEAMSFDLNYWLPIVGISLRQKLHRRMAPRQYLGGFLLQNDLAVSRRIREQLGELSELERLVAHGQPPRRSVRGPRIANAIAQAS